MVMIRYGLKYDLVIFFKDATSFLNFKDHKLPNCISLTIHD
jgi:hypothetical protein